MESMGGDIIFYPVAMVAFAIILTLIDSDYSCGRKRHTRRDAAFLSEFPHGIDSDVQAERDRLYRSLEDGA